MQQLKKPRKLRLTAETVRTLTKDRLAHVGGGAIITHSWCDSESFGCSDNCPTNTGVC